MLAIVYERVVAPLQSNRTHVAVNRLITLIWILPMFQGVVDLFTSSSLEEEENLAKKHPNILGSCALVPIFGSELATIINECFRFAIFQLAVTLYMAFAILKIWLSLQSIYNISPTFSENFEKKLQSIRYILLHLALFIIFWIPIGFFTFARKLASYDIPLIEDTQKDWLYVNIKDETSFLNKFIGLSTLVYLTFNPIINLLLLDDNKVKVCPSCNADDYTVSTTSTPPPPPPPMMMRVRDGDESEDDMEMNRMGYLKKNGNSVVYATGRELRSSEERETSQHSSDDMGPCSAKVVQAEVIVHKVGNDLESGNDVKPEQSDGSVLM